MRQAAPMVRMVASIAQVPLDVGVLLGVIRRCGQTGWESRAGAGPGAAARTRGWQPLGCAAWLVSLVAPVSADDIGPVAVRDDIDDVIVRVVVSSVAGRGPGRRCRRSSAPSGEVAVAMYSSKTRGSPRRRRLPWHPARRCWPRRAALCSWCWTTAATGCQPAGSTRRWMGPRRAGGRWCRGRGAEDRGEAERVGPVVAKARTG